MSCCPRLPQHRGWWCSAGMVAQRRGWPHRAGGDGGDAPHWSDVTASSCTGAGLSFVPLSRVLLSSFEGCDVEAVQEWAAQCHGVGTSLPAQLHHSAREGLTGRFGGTTPGYDSQVVSEGQHGEDSLLTPAPAACLERGGVSPEGAWVQGLRAWGGLERGGVSPEGASGPRARWRFARGGASPSSEVEYRPRGRQALERDGESQQGAPAPRARCSTTEGYHAWSVGGPLWFL
jgi:hypothetical protein